MFLFCYLFITETPKEPQRPRQKPRPPPKPQVLPQVEALYDYQASDTDEISLTAGQKLFLLKEGNNALSKLNRYFNFHMHII